MDGKLRDAAVRAAAALGVMAAGPAGAETLFLSYGHTPVYTPVESELEQEVYAHSFAFGAYLDAQARVGLYHEHLEGNAQAMVRGVSIDYELLGVPGWAARLGGMIGSQSGEGEGGPVRDLYVLLAVRSHRHASLDTKLAYRAMPSDAMAELVDDTSGLYVNLSFSVHF